MPAGITLTIGDGPAIAEVNSITVSMRHSFLGDLVVRVIPPTGPQFTLFDRPGYPSDPPSDGYGSNLGADNSPDDIPTATAAYTFTEIGINLEVFADPAHASPTEEITTTPLGFPSYFAESWVDGPFPAGTWRIFLSDNAPNDMGIIEGVSINFVAVPEPGETALATSLFLAGIGTLRGLRARGRKPHASV